MKIELNQLDISFLHTVLIRFKLQCIDELREAEEGSVARFSLDSALYAVTELLSIFEDANETLTRFERFDSEEDTTSKIKTFKIGDAPTTEPGSGVFYDGSKENT